MYRHQPDDTNDVGQIYPLILELRHMVEPALWPYVNQAT